MGSGLDRRAAGPATALKEKIVTIRSLKPRGSQMKRGDCVQGKSDERSVAARYLNIWLGLVAANLAYAAMASAAWDAAIERSFFEALPLLVVWVIDRLGETR
jgi:hypothetical protein